MWKIENQNKDFDYFAPRVAAIAGILALAILAALARHQYPGLWRDVGVVLACTLAAAVAGAVFVFVFTDAARQVREVLKGEPDTSTLPEDNWQGWEYDRELAEIQPHERLENQPEARSRFVRGEVETNKGIFGKVDKDIVEAWKARQEARAKKGIEFEVEK